MTIRFFILIYIVFCNYVFAAEDPVGSFELGDVTSLSSADDSVGLLGSDGTGEIVKLINYTVAYNAVKAQQEAVNIYQEAAGTDQKALDIGIKLAKLEGFQTAMLDSLSSEFINYDLYLRPPQVIKDIRQVLYIEEPSIQIFDNHSRIFCSAKSDLEKAVFPTCTGAQESGALEQKFQYGDLKPSNLLDYDRINVSENGELNKTGEFVALSLIQNLINATPKFQTKSILQDYLAQKEEEPDLTLAATQKRKVAEDLSNVALFAVARNSLLNMYTDRIAIDVNLDKNYTSIKSLTKDEIFRRYKNKEWYQKIAISSEEALLREMVHMQAFKNWMQLRKQRQQERMETILSARLALDQRFNAVLNEVSEAAGIEQ